MNCHQDRWDWRFGWKSWRSSAGKHDSARPNYHFNAAKC